MNLLINIIPLAVIIVLLFKKQHMLFAGLVGGIIAVLIGGLDLAKASEMFVGGINNMMSITVPIIYAASAAMVSKAGSIESLVELAGRKLKGRISILVGFIVLIQGLATYMAGMGAGNSMITAPLAAAAVGAIPEVIAAMAIVSGVGFTTSPASTETVLAAESAGIDVMSQAAAMRPYTVIFYLLAVGLAVYGVYKRGSITKGSIDKEDKFKGLSNSTLFKHSLPAIALLLMVIGGSKVNSLIGINLFSPATTVIFTSILTVLLTPLNINQTCESLIDGSRFILTTLFSVGIFLSFINMIGGLGTFEQLASLVSNVPESIIVPVAMITAFLIAIPSGAFAAGVLTLVLPTLSQLGLPPESMGFVAIATGLGTQVSPVQINIAALSKGFETDIIDIVKGNLKYVLGALILLIIIAVVVI